MPHAGDHVQRARVSSGQTSRTKNSSASRFGRCANDPMNKQPARFRLLSRRPKPLQIDSVRQQPSTRRAGHHARGSFCRHGHHADPPPPRRAVSKSAPALQLPPQSPSRRSSTQQLLVEIEGDVVLHQDRPGGRAVRRILRHLREFQLRDRRPPFAHGLAQRGVESRRNRTPPPRRAGRCWAASGCRSSLTSTTSAQICSSSAGGYRAAWRSRPAPDRSRARGAAHQVEHAHGAAMRERKRSVGRSDENHGTSRSARARGTPRRRRERARGIRSPESACDRTVRVSRRRPAREAQRIAALQQPQP